MEPLVCSNSYCGNGLFAVQYKMTLSPPPLAKRIMTWGLFGFDNIK